MVRIICVVTLLIFARGIALSQNTKGANYFNLSSESSMVVHDLAEGQLNIEYDDRYGSSNALVMTLYNWRNELVGKYTLSKSFGLNHFKIDLTQVFANWKEGEVYSCRAVDEGRKEYELLVRKKLPASEDLAISIFANPLKVSCNEIDGNTIDFYGTIAGGKAPYTVQWFILNDAKSEFLYQPRKDVIDRPGRTMIVGVDKNPSYYVMVLVTDACNQEARQMMYLTCHDKKKKVNTLFVEPLKQLPDTHKKTN